MRRMVTVMYGTNVMRNCGYNTTEHYVGGPSLIEQQQCARCRVGNFLTALSPRQVVSSVDHSARCRQEVADATATVANDVQIYIEEGGARLAC